MTLARVLVCLKNRNKAKTTPLVNAVCYFCLLFHFHCGYVVCAEILLQQAMAGSSPNSLLLSYLKHTVLSQVSTTIVQQ